MPTKKTSGKKLTNSGISKSDNPVAIVGIGASAGGLEAFSNVLKSLPDDTGMAFVFIQHLEPSHESSLPEIFSKFTQMHVQQITRTTKVKRNQVYIIPPGKYLSIETGKLFLSERQKTDGMYLPIDYFFNSLAKEEKNKAIGIILSGTASDGTEGLGSIKAEGGLTFAQDQNTTKYSGMVISAIKSGNVDMILPPDKIARELVRIGTHPYIAFTPHKEEEPSENNDAYSRIFAKLRSVTGVDFSYYKLNTIKRRITRRMVLHKSDTINDYAKLIEDSKNEVQELYNNLLINVTNFYRDPEVFSMLNSKVFPNITRSKFTDSSIRIWVPGCSTGEEVYSIAITLFEYLESKNLPGSMHIFATDISEIAIDKARMGIYPETAIKNLPSKIIKKYFNPSNGNYQINKSIRDVCIFAKHDISKDPPFSKIDFISCRNLLIYFSSDLQKKIIPVFHYALKPGGYLLLGTSESVGGFGDLFHLSDRKFKLYVKKQTSVRPDLNFSYSSPPEKSNTNNINEFRPVKLDLQREADRVILNKFSPPGILVNSSMEIIQFRGKVNKYLDPSIGDASLNVFKMLREILNPDLHSAIRKVKQTNKPVNVENIYFDSNGTNYINLEVIPLKINNRDNDTSYLVLFRENISDNSTGNSANKSNKKNVKSKPGISQEIIRLKEELVATRESLQSIIEERESANEELRLALEELQSSNEELQSTNEEMETTREELQSTNEELITVNDELEIRNGQLIEINNDLGNLLSSISVPIIMLGRDLKIRRYTQKAEKIWNLISGDVGRPIVNINPNLQIPDLKENLYEVLDNFESKSLNVKDNEGNWYSMKIRPYRTMDNKVEGVVISLDDVDILKKGYDIAVEGRNFAQEVFSNVEGAIVVFDSSMKLVDATKTFFEMFSLDPKISIGKVIYETGSHEWDNDGIKKLFMGIMKDNLKDYSYELNGNDGGHKNILLNTQKFHVPGKESDYVLMSITEKAN